MTDLSYPKVMTYLYLATMTVLLLILFTSLSSAPWVPTRKKDIEGILDDAQVKTDSIFIELGCGDGRLVKAAAMRGAKAVGYELNPILWLFALFSCLGIADAKIKFKNFWSVDLSQADAVMAFGLPRTLPRLDKKLTKELKPTAIFISYVFPVEGRKPIKRRQSWLVYKYKTAKSK